MTGLTTPPLEQSVDSGQGGHSHTGKPSDACMFCSDDLGLRSTGDDPIGFLDHLDRNDDCQREYQMWKQVITDEWHGD